MAKFKKPLYYCFECKKILPDMGRIFLLDEHSQKCFCSEDCIEDFHRPLVKYFQSEEKELRKKYLLSDEQVPIEINRTLLDHILPSPDEVYRFSNDLGESFYHIIKLFPGKGAVVLIANVFKGEVSYIFGSVVSNEKRLIDEYRQGEEIDLASWMAHKKAQLGQATHEAQIGEDEDPAFMQLIESKKSSLLATLLVKRKDQDIPIESFVEYDFCFQETLDHPDEVFEYKDQEGDTFFHYIKNYGLGERKEDNFFYVVLCLKQKRAAGSETLVYPVLGMPTNDMALVNEFCVGKQLSGPLKN